MDFLEIETSRLEITWDLKSDKIGYMVTDNKVLENTHTLNR